MKSFNIRPAKPEEDGVVIGFALFFHNFSTFVGRKGMYLEDLFILPEKRGLGYGKALLKYVARIAVERHCGPQDLLTALKYTIDPSLWYSSRV